MKYTFLTIAITLSLFSSVFASSVSIDYFSARNDGDAVQIEWKSGIESGIKSYAVERSDVRSNDFQEIGTAAATGSYTYYKFRDQHPAGSPAVGQSAPAPAPLSDLYKYRLRMNLASSEISYSQTISVSRPSSGVRRTWGMIKEMFH